MARNKKFASTLEKELIPFLQSVEDFLSSAGIEASSFSSYTDARLFITEAAKIIRSGRQIWPETADAVLIRIDELQDGLSVILAKMPAGFTHEWNRIGEHLERDNRALLEP